MLHEEKLHDSCSSCSVTGQLNGQGCDALNIRGRIQKFPDWVDTEINNNNKHSLRSNKKGYGDKTHKTDSQNNDTTAPSGRELYHLQSSLQASSPETFGCTRIELGGGNM